MTSLISAAIETSCGWLWHQLSERILIQDTDHFCQNADTSNAYAADASVITDVHQKNRIQFH